MNPTFDLSILIPARNEQFLARTVEDILSNIEGKTEVIVVLDGQWAEPAIPDDPRVRILYYPESIGQRAATNRAAAISTAKYLMKVDAHCAFDKGFDVKMMESMHDDWTMAPTMRNLHAFDYVCPDGHRRYQSPSGPCLESGCGKPTVKEMVWKPRSGTHNSSYYFDPEPHFQYGKEQNQKPGYDRGTIMGYNLFLDEPGPSPRVVGLLADFADSHHLSSCADFLRGRKDMSMDAMGLSSVDSSGSIRSSQVDGVVNQLEVGRVAASPIPTEVINNGDILTPTSGERADKPSVGDSMGQCFLVEMGTPTISGSILSPLPIPTTGKTIDSDVVNELNNILGGEFVYNEKTSRFHNGNVSLEPVYDKGIVATMSLQGSCFMITREKYWYLKICDEETFGSWGSQGIEVACKTWLSGGQVMVNRKTWYAHMFRTQGGDFGFPYSQSGRGVERAKKTAKEVFFNGKFEKAIYPLSWLIEKFWPISYWKQEDLDNLKAIEAANVVKPPTKGIIFYTDNQLPVKIARAVQSQLRRVSGQTGIPIVSASLKPMTNMGTNIHLPLVRGYLTMFKQILAALEASTADIIYFCEHDVLYPKEYFNFTPDKKDTYFYNINWWKIRLADGFAVSWEAPQVSGLCAYRELVLDHYRKRVAIIEKYGYNHSMGFEPGAHNYIESIKTRDNSKIPPDIYIDDVCIEKWKSEVPQVDLKHSRNLSRSKWGLHDFRDRATAVNFVTGECPKWAVDVVTPLIGIN
jgi:hypothetical protein